MTEKYQWIVEESDEKFQEKAFALDLEALRESIFVTISFLYDASSIIRPQMRSGGDKYCGRCNEKSRSYEGGKCSCDYQLKSYKEKLHMLQWIYFEKAEEESKVAPECRNDVVAKLLKLEKIE